MHWQLRRKQRQKLQRPRPQQTEPYNSHVVATHNNRGFCDQPPNTMSGEARETRRKESGDALRDEPLRGRGIGDKEAPHRLRCYQVDGVIEGGGWSATHECTTARFRSFFVEGERGTKKTKYTFANGKPKQSEGEVAFG